MRKIIAAAVVALCPLVLLGLVGGYEVGRLPFWGLIPLGAGIIYAEWWGLATLDNTDD